MQFSTEIVSFWTLPSCPSQFLLGRRDWPPVICTCQQRNRIKELVRISYSLDSFIQGTIQDHLVDLCDAP